jgi:hypothetical protein
MFWEDERMKRRCLDECILYSREREGEEGWPAVRLRLADGVIRPADGVPMRQQLFPK